MFHASVQVKARSEEQGERELFRPLAFSLLISLVIAFFATPARAESSHALAAAMNSISSAELYEHVEVLADDVYEGRAAGSRGGRAAGQYLIKELRSFGFQPAGREGDYVQRFGRDWRNILAIRPGYDPELEQEIIVVGAHYDHVGYGNRSNSLGPIGRIHNGADDNASGTAVLLETMEAFAASGLRTRRSILFAFWDGEENGLVGSRHWLSHPTIPTTGVSDPGYKIRLALTIDMVGRLREGRLHVLGTRSGFGMRRLMSGPVENPLWLDFSWELQDNSDHWSFLERRVPVVLLHTGLHRDYHRPSDDAEKINRDGLLDVSRYLLGVLIKAANEDQLPTYRGRVRSETEGQRQRLERPLAPASLENWPSNEPRPRLGISWREDEAERGTVFLTRVVESSPADAAGLAVLDRVHDINGNPFADAAGFQSAIIGILDSSPPEFTLLTERRGHLRTVTVKMPSVSQETRAESQEPERGEP
jgi:hypothetical protein